MGLYRREADAIVAQEKALQDLLVEIYAHSFPDCAACGQTFTVEEWEVRHSDSDGDDVHAECCDICILDKAGK